MGPSLWECETLYSPWTSNVPFQKKNELLIMLRSPCHVKTPYFVSELPFISIYSWYIIIYMNAKLKSILGKNRLIHF